MNLLLTNITTRRALPLESGPLTIQGAHFYDQSGAVWRWRGASMFLLLERQMRGEDITPQLDWMVTHGINVAREFVAGVPWAGHDWLYQRADWPEQLGRHADRLAAAGIILEATVGTDQCDDVNRWAPILQSIYDVLEPRAAMSFGEWINEPWIQGQGLIAASINRHGILSSYGIQPSDTMIRVPMLDYGTVHLPRDLDHFGRNSKDLLELQQVSEKPWISDEPLGIAHYDKAGSGARTTSRAHVAGHFAIAALFGAGSTMHSTFGLEGRIPSVDEPISESLARMISDIWQFIPAETQLGTYSRMGLSDFPLVVADGDSLLSSTHAYASILGDVAYAVLPVPRPDYVAAGANGWSITAQLADLPIWKMVRP